MSNEQITDPEEQWYDAGWLYHTTRGFAIHPGKGFAILFWLATAAVEPEYWYYGALVGFIWPAIMIATCAGVSRANPPWREWDRHQFWDRRRFRED